MMSNQQLNWGILGTSPISDQMVTAINASKEGKAHGVASRSNEKARHFASQHDIPHTYTQAEEILADDNIDVVYIGLPNHLHLTWAIKALDAGKHVLCEKPLVCDQEDALRLIEAAQSSGLFCMEAIMYRCHPHIQRLKDIIDSGCLGEIKSYHAIYSANIAHLANPVLGGAIYNLGCYPMSLILYLTGMEASEMSAMGVANQQFPDNDTLASVIMRFANDTLATITTADSVDMYWSFDVIGTEGRLKAVTNPWLPPVGEQQSQLFSHDSSHPELITTKSPTCVYTQQIDTVNRQILHPATQSPERVSLQESLRCVTALEQWRKLSLSPLQ